MSQKKRKSAIETELPIKYVKMRKILEFPLYKVKDGEAIIVRTKKWGGFSEPCFVVSNSNGKITIKQIKEEK